MHRRTILLAVVLLATIVVDGVLLQRRQRYVVETARLRGDMTVLERQKADAIVDAHAGEAGLMLELMRRQAAGDDALHLAINTDSSYVLLERDGAILRRFDARIGRGRRVGVPPDTLQVSTPLGTRSVERLVAVTDAFELPPWIWTDRGLPIPAQRAEPGWTGPDAVVTTGGTLIYAVPAFGPLADSSYVMPGSVRVAPSDLVAIRANLTRGTKVYFY